MTTRKTPEKMKSCARAGNSQTLLKQLFVLFRKTVTQIILDDFPNNGIVREESACSMQAPIIIRSNYVRCPTDWYFLRGSFRKLHN